MRLKHWFALFRDKNEILRQFDHLELQIERAKKESRAAQADLEIVTESVNMKLAEHRDHTRKVEEANKSLENALNGATQKLEILEEITIPNLMKLLSTYSSNWDCQSAQNAMRTAYAENREQQRVE